MISVIVPVYDEELVLPDFLRRLRTVMDSVEQPYEVLVVDDGSDDRTIAVARDTMQQWPQLRVLSLGRNRGHQVALMAGLSQARGATIVTMDGDGQHPPEALPDAIQELIHRDLDVLHMRRDGLTPQSRFKRIPSDLFYRGIEALMDGEAAAPVGDFRVLSRRASVALQGLSGPVVIRAALPLLGLRSGELEYREGLRSAGQSKYTVRRMSRLAVDAALNVSTRPLRVTSTAAIIVTGIAGLWSIAVVVAFLQGQTVAGWPSVMLAVLVLGSIQLTVLAVQGQYLARMYDVVLGRHDPVVQEIFARDESVGER